jgi:vitamin B12 transporter
MTALRLSLSNNTYPLRLFALRARATSPASGGGKKLPLPRGSFSSPACGGGAERGEAEGGSGSYASLSALVLVCVGLMSAATPLSAEDVQRNTERVVVTANRIEMPLEQVGASISVVDAEEERNKGNIFVLEALTTVPGLTVTQSGGPGGQAVVRLRGEENYRTLVLVDGIRIADPAAPQSLTEFAHLLLSDIERIEIVRGPQSLLYGADAIGGVVNIITKRGEPGFHGSVTASPGSFGTMYGSTSLSGADGPFDASTTVSFYRTEGFTAREGAGFSEDDGYENVSAHAVVGFEPAEDVRLEGIFRATDAEADFDRFGDTNDVLYTEQVAGRLSADFPLFGLLENTISGSYLTQNRADYANGAPFSCPPFNCGATFDAERWRGEYLGTIALSDSDTLILGADYEDEEVITDFLVADRWIWGVYGEWAGEPVENLFLTLGARYDEQEQFGDHFTWRATAAYLFELIGGEGETKLRASAGTGFRAPSLFELFDAFSGDPDLLEEQGDGFDLGFDQPLWQGAVTLGVTYFDQKIEDEIRFDPNLFIYIQNPGTSTSRGVETRVTVEATDDLLLDANYTYTDATINSDDAEDGLPRQRRPRHVWHAGASYTFLEGQARLSLAARGEAEAEDGFFIFRTKLDAYAVVDVSGSYSFADGWLVALRGTNVLDEQYQTVAGFATADAAASLTLRGSF